MTDLSDIQPSTVVHEVVHPGTGEPIGIKFELLPMTAPPVKSIVRQIQDQVNYLAARQKTMSARDREAYTIKLNASAVVSWDWGDNTFEGGKPEYSNAKVQEIFGKCEWLRSQIDDALGETKSFFE